MKSNWIVVGLLILVVGAGGYYYMQKKSASKQKTFLKTEASLGNFDVRVTATGELQAKRSEKILGPQGMRAAGIFQTNISDIIAEGTLVEEGSYVATLDRTELADKLKNVANDIEKTESQLLQAKLDTAIELRSLRDQLVNLKYSVEEKKLEAELNVYEPPAVQRQTQIELEKIKRDMIQSDENYRLKKEQAEARIKEIHTTLDQQKDNLSRLNQLSGDFTIKAPKAGMVIYERTFNGKKGPGSRINFWDPAVAQLPDMSDMISLTYVNEVDISKVKPNQEVTIRVDAFPEYAYTGKVLSVANIGEQRPNFDAKVFEVKIQLIQSDSILRPAMTTSNDILTRTLDEVLSVPLEAVFSNDSSSFVFLETSPKKVVRQEVITGLSNDTRVILEAGLNSGDLIYLNSPDDPEEFPFIPVSPDIKNAYLQKKQEQQELRNPQVKREDGG